MTYQFRSIADAIAVAGSIGFPSKMPGTSYGIPAEHCKTGTKLRAVLNSTCSNCYAYERNNYRFRDVKAAQQKRFDSLTDPAWRDAVTFILRKYHGLVDGHVHRKIVDPFWHRWHDAGDVQNEAHLDAIADVCIATPQIMHWLPTRELALVKRWLKSRYGATLEQMNDVIPANLCIRISATMIDGPATERAPNTSRVSTKTEDSDCPAPQQDGKCGPCRKCWDKTNANTTYHLHN